MIKGDTATDIETLKELDEIRKTNFDLEKKNDELRKQLNEKNQIKDISCGSDEFGIRYRYKSRYDGGYYNDKVNTTWDILFASIGPSFISSKNISDSKNIIEEAIERIENKQYYSIKINEDDFNTIKIQFDALDLIKYFLAKTVSGGTAEFMQLTKNGKEKLKLLKVKRKSA